MPFYRKTRLPCNQKQESFLIEASRVGQGDTQKRIDVTKICGKLDLSQGNERFINRILQPLVAKGYIEEIPNQNEITVTRRGFYYAIKVSGERKGQGMVKQTD